jgi:hypothetical protein
LEEILKRVEFEAEFGCIGIESVAAEQINTVLVKRDNFRPHTWVGAITHIARSHRVFPSLYLEGDLFPLEIGLLTYLEIMV